MTKKKTAHKPAFVAPFEMPAEWWQAVEGLAALYCQDPRALLTEMLRDHAEAARDHVDAMASKVDARIAEAGAPIDALIDRMLSRRRQTARRAA